MSIRFKTNDHFWFSFFHEAAHILLHPKKAIFIDFKDDDSTEEEREANDFAGDLLIPEDEYDDFIETDSFFADDIERFAKKIKVHPAIVVGRLQHDKKIEHKWHNKFKEKYEIKPG